MNQAVHDAVKKIWDYHLLHQPLEKADCMLVLGSYDTRVAEWAADLFLKGYAPLIVFSGNEGAFTKEWKESEARIFADIAIKKGVPKERILIEERSTNTGENIVFSKKLLDEHGVNPKTLLLVQKPYMERRMYATFKKQWPEKPFSVTSPPIALDDYPNDRISETHMINCVLGDLQRIRLYPEKGFQIPQEIPKDVWEAFEFLVAKGYTKGVIQ